MIYVYIYICHHALRCFESHKHLFESRSCLAGVVKHLVFKQVVKGHVT